MHATHTSLKQLPRLPSKPLLWWHTLTRATSVESDKTCTQISVRSFESRFILLNVWKVLRTVTSAATFAQLLWAKVLNCSRTYCVREVSDPSLWFPSGTTNTLDAYILAVMATIRFLLQIMSMVPPKKNKKQANESADLSCFPPSPFFIPYLAVSDPGR